MTAKQFQMKYGNPDNRTSQESSPKSQRPSRHEPLAKTQVEDGDTGRFLVHVVSHRRRLLDEDNLVCKWHVDLLRYSGCIPDDAPNQASIKVSQVKVSKKEEEKTIITVIKP